MFRILLLAAIVPAPAFAHVGHIGDLAGHDHWVIGAAIGAAIAAGLWGALKGEDEDEEVDEELAEA